MAGMLNTKALTPAMVDDLYGQYNRMFTPADQLQSTGDPIFDAQRQKMLVQNAVMQGNAGDLPYPQQAGGPLEISVPASPMFDQQSQSMVPQANSLLEAAAMGIAAPEGQTPFGDYVGANWQDLLSQGIAGLEDQYYRENLPADTYLKMRAVENEKELAKQNQLLENLKLQSDLDYRKQSLDLQREELAVERQKVLSGGSGSSYMEDARLLMQSDPSLDLGSAYAQARSGLPRGVFVNPQTDQVEAMAGFGDVTSQLAAQEATAKTLATEKAKVDVAVQAALNKKTVDSTDALSLIAKAEELLPKATAGGLQEGVKSGAAFFGESTDGSIADAQLNILSSKLVSAVPRMEGPQSDKDSELYRKAAGDLANTALPTNDRMAAAGLMRELAMKYAKPTATAPSSDIDAQIKALEQELGLTQ